MSISSSGHDAGCVSTSWTSLPSLQHLRRLIALPPIPRFQKQARTFRSGQLTSGMVAPYIQGFFLSSFGLLRPDPQVLCCWSGCKLVYRCFDRRASRIRGNSYSILHSGVVDCLKKYGLQGTEAPTTFRCSQLCHCPLLRIPSAPENLKLPPSFLTIPLPRGSCPSCRASARNRKCGTPLLPSRSRHCSRGIWPESL